MIGNMELISIEILTAHGDHYAHQTYNVENNIAAQTHSHKSNPELFAHFSQNLRSH